MKDKLARSAADTRPRVPHEFVMMEAQAIIDRKRKLNAIFEALSEAWEQVMAAVNFPQDYNGEHTPEAHRATGEIETLIREHIISGGDKRLFSLMHLLGQAFLRMEQELYPEYDKWFREQVEEGLKEADDPTAQWVPNEVVEQDMANPNEQVEAHFAKKRAALLEQIEKRT